MYGSSLRGAFVHLVVCRVFRTVVHPLPAWRHRDPNQDRAFLFSPVNVGSILGCYLKASR